MNILKKRSLIRQLGKAYQDIKRLSDAEYIKMRSAVAESKLPERRELVSILVLMRIADFG